MSNVGLMTNNYLLIKAVSVKDESAGGIILTKKEVGTIRLGYVISCGEGLVNFRGVLQKPDLDVGDLVYFAKAGPERIDYSDVGIEDTYVLSEGDVYAKIKFAGNGDVEILPMGNLVYIEELEDTVKTVSAGGIYLPEKSLERPSLGLVKSVGPGQRTVDSGFATLKISPGDIVRFRKHSTFIVDLKDINVNNTHRLVTYGDIVAVELPGFSDDLKAIINNLRASNNYME